MNKIVFLLVGSALLLTTVIAVVLYKGESEKYNLLRLENLKTTKEAQQEVKQAKEELKRERLKHVEDKEKVVQQMNQFSEERDAAFKELKTLKGQFLDEREISLMASDDLKSLRDEIAKARKENKEAIEDLEAVFKNKEKHYATRILSLEAQLAKEKERYIRESKRYHYNLGVLNTENKEYDAAVKEFKAALTFDPDHAESHYNLGVIYDDYFKDKKNAQYHYRRFLEVAPTSKDAEAVREWLSVLED